MGQTALLTPAVFTCQSPLLDCLPELACSRKGRSFDALELCLCLLDSLSPCCERVSNSFTCSHARPRRQSTMIVPNPDIID